MWELAVSNALIESHSSMGVHSTKQMIWACASWNNAVRNNEFCHSAGLGLE